MTTKNTQDVVAELENPFDGHSVALFNKYEKDYAKLCVTAAKSGFPAPKNPLTQLVKEVEEGERERLSPWIEHDSQCILSQYQRGEPTEDGGYRMMFAGKWYNRGEHPDCDCGLDSILTPPTSELNEK